MFIHLQHITVSKVLLLLREKKVKKVQSIIAGLDY